MEKLFSSVHRLQSQLANSPVDTELRDLRGAIRDLSHHLPSLSSNYTQNRPSATHPPAVRTGPASGGPSLQRPPPVQPGLSPPTLPLPTRVPPPTSPMLPSSTEALVGLTKPQLQTPQSARLKAKAPPALGLQRPKSRPSWRPLLRRALLPSPALPEGSTPPAKLMPLNLTKPLPASASRTLLPLSLKRPTPSFLLRSSPLSTAKVLSSSPLSTLPSPQSAPFAPVPTQSLNTAALTLLPEGGQPQAYPELLRCLSCPRP